MNRDEVMAAYPGAATAVELCEELENWDMYRGVAVREGIPAMRERMRKSLMEAMERNEGELKEILQGALAQWDHSVDLVSLLILVPRLVQCNVAKIFEPSYTI